VSGCAEGHTAQTALQHYLEAERLLWMKTINKAETHPRLDAGAMLHYVAALAAAQIEARR
jgi:hypothetical protein